MQFVIDQSANLDGGFYNKSLLYQTSRHCNLSFTESVLFIIHSINMIYKVKTPGQTLYIGKTCCIIV